LPITDGRVGLYLQGPHLPSSSNNLSCLLHLLINLVIALAVAILYDPEEYWQVMQQSCHLLHVAAWEKSLNLITWLWKNSHF